MAFHIDDICNYIEIWDIVYQIMQKVFGNMEGGVGVDVDELSSDEDLFPADWDDLGVDKELASMAIDNNNKMVSFNKNKPKYSKFLISQVTK